MYIIIRTLGFLCAAIACGHALGQYADHHERLSLHGVPMRTIAEQQAPQEQRLRLYLEPRASLRSGGHRALPEPVPRIGLELKLASNPTLVDARGLLRTKLSESTSLSLRVRRHGVGVVLRSEF